MCWLLQHYGQARVRREALQLRELGTNPRDGKRRPTPQLGEINTPRTMDAAEGCSLYDGFMAGILAWTNRVSEC